MMGCWAKGRGLLEGGCPASVWAEFRGMWWTVVLGILEGMGVGFCVNFWVVGGECWVGLLWEGGEELQEASAKLGGEFGRVSEGVSGSGLLRKEGMEDLSFSVDF